MRLALLLGLMLVSCDAPSATKTKKRAAYRGSNFRCTHPADWNVVVNHDDPGSASVEFDFPGPGFATVIIFQPENQGAFDRYTQISAEKFPKIHEREYPAQKVTTVGIREKTKLGSLDALKTTHSIFVAPNDRTCVFNYVNLTSPEMVALVDVFDEGTALNPKTIASLEQFIASITPQKPTGTPASPDEGDEPVE
jgi:hypothetical protein